MYFLGFATPMVIIFYLILLIPRYLTRGLSNSVSILYEAGTVGIVAVLFWYANRDSDFSYLYFVCWFIAIAISYLFYYKNDKRSAMHKIKEKHRSQIDAQNIKRNDKEGNNK